VGIELLMKVYAKHAHCQILATGIRSGCDMCGPFMTCDLCSSVAHVDRGSPRRLTFDPLNCVWLKAADHRRFGRGSPRDLKTNIDYLPMLLDQQAQTRAP
jgi:hypothetical protein